MINQLYHAPTLATVQFDRPPNRGNGEQAARYQLSGYDSDGAAYVYAKNNIKHRGRTLVYPHQSSAVLAGVITFLQARGGDRDLFTWYDHDGAAHSCRFTAGNLKYKQELPGRHRIEIKVSEDTP